MCICILTNTPVYLLQEISLGTYILGAQRPPSDVATCSTIKIRVDDSWLNGSRGQIKRSLGGTVLSQKKQLLKYRTGGDVRIFFPKLKNQGRIFLLLSSGRLKAEEVWGCDEASP